MTRSWMLLLSLISSLLVTVPAQTKSESPSCTLALEVLKEVGSLKAGMHRAEVEKNFMTDGGLSYRENTTYIYKKCHYIKIDVEFQIDPNADKDSLPDFPPTDIITKISRPYIAYQVMD